MIPLRWLAVVCLALWSLLPLGCTVATPQQAAQTLAAQAKPVVETEAAHLQETAMAKVKTEAAELQQTGMARVKTEAAHVGATVAVRFTEVADSGKLNACSGGLAVPFVSQYECRPEGYKGWNNGGPASLAMVLSFFGKRPAGLPDADWVHRVRYAMTGVTDAGPSNGLTGLVDWQRACACYGVTCTTLPSIPAIEEAVRQGQPVICAVNARKLSPMQYSPELAVDQAHAHIILVRGFGQDRDGVPVVYVNDPLSNPARSNPVNGSPGCYYLDSWKEAVEQGGVMAISVSGSTPQATTPVPKWCQ